MKINELLYKTPEMTEEKLLEIINKEFSKLKTINKFLVDRILEIHKNSSESTAELILKEYDLIQEKKSLLTKSQRDLVIGFVGACMIEMIKDDETNSGGDIQQTD